MAELIPLVLFWSALALLGYVYLGYPLLAWGLRKRGRVPWRVLPLSRTSP